MHRNDKRVERETTERRIKIKQTALTQGGPQTKTKRNYFECKQKFQTFNLEFSIDFKSQNTGLAQICTAALSLVYLPIRKRF